MRRGNVLRTAALAAVLVLLSACGGGGDKDSPSYVFTYSGNVRSAGGTPLEGIRVNLAVYGDACPCQFFCNHVRFANTRTDVNGAFSLSADTTDFYTKCVQYRVFLQSETPPCTEDRAKACYGATEETIVQAGSLGSISGIVITPMNFYRAFGTVTFPMGLVSGQTDPFLKIDCYSTQYGCPQSDVVNGKFFLPFLRPGTTYTLQFFAQGCSSTATATEINCNDKYTFTPPYLLVTPSSADLDVAFVAVPK